MFHWARVEYHPSGSVVYLTSRQQDIPSFSFAEMRVNQITQRHSNHDRVCVFCFPGTSGLIKSSGRWREGSGRNPLEHIPARFLLRSFFYLQFVNCLTSLAPAHVQSPSASSPETASSSSIAIAFLDALFTYPNPTPGRDNSHMLPFLLPPPPPAGCLSTGLL